MKYNVIIKIGLSVIVIALLAFCVWKWSGGGLFSPSKPQPPKNQFVERIEEEIDSINNVPSNSFCSDYYHNILYHISDYHKRGYLGDTSVSDNDQWKEILSKNLYSAYAPKFVQQAMSVFKGHEWNTNDLNFIRIELKELQKSDYLEPQSSMASSFNTIRAVLSKYDEINAFLAKCRRFSYTDDRVASVFPNVNDYIRQSKHYINNKMENVYVNNCSRLKDGLIDVPKILLDKHISYLHNKINRYACKYKDYATQAEYNKEVYSPLRNQINNIDYRVYELGERLIDQKQDELFDLLGEYNHMATDYFLNN